ncbi:MAG: pantoate--beta-alanine ligase, partial [Candidatus Methylumidiphilus sp.]
DGLALSSRNSYLSAEEKQRAAKLYQSLRAAAAALAAGVRDYPAIEAEQTAFLCAEGFGPDYFAVRRLADLAAPCVDEREFTVLAAAWLGRARLIDNVQVRV